MNKSFQFNPAKKRFRGESLSTEELFELGQQLAKTQKFGMGFQKPSQLVSRFKENYKYLIELNHSFIESSQEDYSFLPAAEWFIDNFYVIREHLKDCDVNLPQKGYPGLPKLLGGKREGYPRIYGIAEKFLAHCDAKFDLDDFYEFIKGYQSQDGLTTKELWMLPMMLRLAFIENLRRLGEDVKRVQEKQEKANYWAARILKEKNLPNKKQGQTFKELTSAHPDPSPAFALQLLERLYNQGENIVPLLKWFERGLNEKGLTVRSAISKERNRQAADQISVTNTIDSMREILKLEWNKIVEKLSHLEEILRGDPAGFYPKMDFKSRNAYRTKVQELADNTNLGEREVAKQLINLTSKEKDPRKKHVGYYLVGEGVELFEKKINYKPTWKEKLSRFLSRHPAKVYFGVLTTLTTLFMGGLLTLGWALGGGWKELAAIGFLGLIPCSEIAISITHLGGGAFLSPKLLPKLEFKKKVPQKHSTMLVIPALLSDKKEIEDLIQRLEVHFLANNLENLNFALLLDYKDAVKEHLPSDKKFLETARGKIRELNEKYPAEFFILIRERKWNPKEKIWMGWERKRGKLREFNRFLLGNEKDTFSIFGGNKKVFSDVKYVITLDRDTRLPKNEAGKLIGTMAHPLNRPVLNSEKTRVEKGYGILQPRLVTSIKEAQKSTLSQLFSGPKGLDPYTGLVSDIYQDLFGEGRYMGKGIYDVNAFERVLGEKFQENLFLSHDHVEGFLARTGFASNLEAFEDFPTTYHSFCMRKNRWERGDFQLLNWLGKKIKNKKGDVVKNPLPIIGRWVLLNNLRKHLLPIFNFFFLIGGWFLFPQNPLVWTALVLFEMGFFTITALTQEIIGQSVFTNIKDGWKGCLENLSASIDWAKNFSISLKKVILEFTFLAHQAFLMLEGALQALIRKHITKRKLLQWTTASSAEKLNENSFSTLFWFMKSGIILGIICSVAALSRRRGMVPVVFSSMWIFSPVFAWWASRPRQEKTKLRRKDKIKLRRLARKNWRFFDDLVGAETNFLPLDTFQNTPQKKIAWKTSPTNIGLYLLSAISAHNLGYISTLKFLNLLEKTLFALEKLQKYKGHLYNWYNIKNLKILAPHYISSVDSGNLCASFIVVKNMLEELMESPFSTNKILPGLKDEFQLLKEKIEKIENRKKTYKKHLERLSSSINKTSDSSWQEYLRNVKQEIISFRSFLTREMETADTEGARKIKEIYYWLEKLSSHTDDFYYERNGFTKDPKKATESAARRCENLSQRFDKLTEEMDFSFLYNPDKKLFSLGFRVDKNELDNIYYNFLGSESRLASFVAIAKGDLPAKHWFGMERTLTKLKNKKAVISWGGSLYEYLLPNLFLKNYPETLLHETIEVAVKKQIQYGERKGIPWGLSESAYNAQNKEGFYHYKAFGVPDLGVKFSLGKEPVVSPYSTMLALPRFPKKAIKNLKTLKKEGLEGEYGFYDAIDYTPQRMPAGKRGVVIPTYYAHHKGASLMALTASLNDNPFSKYLFRDSRIKSVEHFLEEKTPRETPTLELHKFKKSRKPRITEERFGFSTTYITEPCQENPSSYFLSNGKYQVMIDESGSGFSKFQDFFVTRFRKDPTRRESGTFFYIKDLDTKDIWSSTFQPTKKPPKNYKILQHENKVEFTRKDGGIETRTEIVVAPRENAEIRRVTLTNQSSKEKELEITSYGKIVINGMGQDLTHPVFSDMLVSSEFLSEKNALLFCRPEADQDTPLWATHIITEQEEPIEFSADRKSFIGRGRTLENPKALEQKLSGSSGYTLDPIMSLRTTVKLAPGEKKSLGFTTALSFRKEEVLSLADKYSKLSTVERTMRLGENYGQLEMRQLTFSPEESLIFQKLASKLLWPGEKLRNTEKIRKNKKKKEDLWGYSISGDHPILLITTSSLNDLDYLPLIRQTIRAQKFLQRKGFIFDLVVLNKESGGYKKELEERIGALGGDKMSGVWGEERGGIFILGSDFIPEENQNLLEAMASVVLEGNKGSLKEQLEQKEEESKIPLFSPHQKQIEAKVELKELVNTDELAFYNNFGGFDEEKEEYVITLRPDQKTPVPWTNVISNPNFGFVVSESGSQFTFCENSRDNRLTPWFGDPVLDNAGEALFVKDEETGKSWSPLAWPKRDKNPYLIRHGKGYVKFKHKCEEISSDLTLFVPRRDPVKIVRFKVKNTSSKERKVSIYYFLEWVLGELRSKTWPHIVTEIDEKSKAIIALNPLSESFSERKAFLWGENPTSLTGDRKEILGPGRGWSTPAGLDKETLSGKVGAGFDPGAGVQRRLNLKPDEEKEIVFLLGEVKSKKEIQALIEKYKNHDNIENSLKEVKSYWEKTTSTLEVETPDKALNVLSSWLPYQILSCRVWARSSFYQPGGAYGFRDQLQDAMGLGINHPEILKKHIIRAAKRQYRDGGVQHWWKPVSNLGLRSSYTDDPLWLVYIVSYYVQLTGDYEFLDRSLPFLESTKEGYPESETMETATLSSDKASLFEHCMRAIEKTFDLGAHGLPKMKGGDWNDGMNKVGVEGQGESIWLAWFEIKVLEEFSEAAKKKGEKEAWRELNSKIKKLKKEVERTGWDGEWYRRAYFDDGTPLGSKENRECKITLTPQAWAFISGGKDKKRLEAAQVSCEKYLVDENEKLINLLWPPFKNPERDPGYIKNYPPGVRENGACYLHAAMFYILGLINQKKKDRAWELFSWFNPIKRSSTSKQVEKYKVEPYILPSDIYASLSPGAGGWSWYTGTAAWVWRITAEFILGLKIRGEYFMVEPCLPSSWPGYKMTLRHGSDTYEITVQNSKEEGKGKRIKLDNKKIEGERIAFQNDGKRHKVEVFLKKE